MNPMDLIPMIGQLSQDLLGHKYMLAVALATTWLVALLSGDSKFPISMPSKWDENRWKPLLVLLVTDLSGVASSVADGASWTDGALTGVRTAVFTLGLYSVVVKLVYGDNVPAWLKKLALIFPPEVTETPKPPVK